MQARSCTSNVDAVLLELQHKLNVEDPDAVYDTGAQASYDQLLAEEAGGAGTTEQDEVPEDYEVAIRRVRRLRGVGMQPSALHLSDLALTRGQLRELGFDEESESEAELGAHITH